MIEGLILFLELVLLFILLSKFRKNSKMSDLGIFSYKNEKNK